MKHFLPLVLLALSPLACVAQETSLDLETEVIRPAEDSDLSEFLWTNRAVVVFADSPADPRFSEQIENLSSQLQMLIDRDVVVLTDSDPSAKSPIRLKLRPRGFMMALVGKDGRILLRKPNPWSVRELAQTIDKTPSRQREVQERRVVP